MQDTDMANGESARLGGAGANQSVGTAPTIQQILSVLRSISGEVRDENEEAAAAAGPEEAQEEEEEEEYYDLPEYQDHGDYMDYEAAEIQDNGADDMMDL